jgi:putative thioredoxin
LDRGTMQGHVLDPEPTVIEVTDADFMERVVGESRKRPVLVDFWADWCGPCKQLSPVLERLAGEMKGQFLLAKMDVDRNQFTASQFRIQSIPNVWAFVDGRPVDQFVGAMPEPVVREFITRLLPTDADRDAAEASEAAQLGDVEAAERGFREALERDPNNREAKLGLGRVLLERGELEEAHELLTPLLPDAEAERMLSAIRVAQWSENAEGSLAGPKRMAAAGRWREALDALLGAVRYSLEDRDAAREAMIDVFAVLGDDDPLTREYRAKLASALF